MNSDRLTIDKYKEGILKSDRITLAKAITLVESSLPADHEISRKLIDAILPFTGKSIRIGITGSPGVGKSTFIETFGKHIITEKSRIAVLTIDPSSQITKGSILGDKTRMEELSKNQNAFIRPSPSREILGGVTNTTREVMLLCEASGFDVIVVETVGVGQSEVTAKNMVDFFLLLELARAGDELQGIKKGIMEMADLVVITKADEDNLTSALQAQAQYQHALHLHAPAGDWDRKVLTCSAMTGKGIKEIWDAIKQYAELKKGSGAFEKNREQQNVSWFTEYFDQLLKTDVASSNEIKKEIEDLIRKIKHDKLSAHSAAKILLQVYHQKIRKKN